MSLRIRRREAPADSSSSPVSSARAFPCHEMKHATELAVGVSSARLELHSGRRHKVGCPSQAIPIGGPTHLFQQVLVGPQSIQAELRAHDTVFDLFTHSRNNSKPARRWCGADSAPKRGPGSHRAGVERRRSRGRRRCSRRRPRQVGRRRWRVENGFGTPARNSYGIPARERRERIVAGARFLLQTGHADELHVALTEINELAAVDDAEKGPHLASCSKAEQRNGPAPLPRGAGAST